jgi:capsular polysaccharide transport system ATP-binding protein
MMALENINFAKADCYNEESNFTLLRNQHRFFANDSRLYTSVGKRTAQEVVSTGQMGCLIYGPYIPLDAGQYQVRIYGALGENCSGAERVEVVTDKGNHILYESSLNRLNGDGCLLSLSLKLDAPCTDLEVRIWVEDHSQVMFSMLEIQPTQKSDLESLEQPRPEECLDILAQNGLPCPTTQQIEAVEQVLTKGSPLVHRSDLDQGDRVDGIGMIALGNITKVYDTRRGPRAVLDGLNLHIVKGEKIGILGRNGAGKSTLMRLISGAELPTYGRIERKMSVSWPLAFGGGFQGSLTGLDNLRFICRVYGVSYEGAVPFVEEFSELGSYLREPVKKYSSGMRARLAFALSMAVEFDCFLIDEIIAVGDSRFHERCHVELFEKRKDRAMILVSHFPQHIREYCDHAGVLIAGKLHMFDQVDEAIALYQELTAPA